MNYQLLKEVIAQLEQFDATGTGKYSNNLQGFGQWLTSTPSEIAAKDELYWEGKENGRTPESVISTQLVHLNRYAKNYSKAAMLQSDFSTQEEFIYLINLKAFGAMTKMELIRKNVHEKPVGMKIIDRLLSQGWVTQKDSAADKRSKDISITKKGLKALAAQMDKIRKASKIVSADLTRGEKLTLIALLHKMESFHQNILQKNFEMEELLDQSMQNYLSN